MIHPAVQFVAGLVVALLFDSFIGALMRSSHVVRG